MKTITELEEEYEKFEIKSKHVNSLEEFLAFIIIGIDDTYEIENDYKKEIKENKRWQLSAKIRNFFNFIFEEEEESFYDYDNNILEELTLLVLKYQSYFKKIAELANKNNYEELLKLTDFLTEYYNKEIDYYEYRRDKLEMELKGLCFSNSRYEDNQKVIDEFANNKLSKLEKASQKVYR